MFGIVTTRLKWIAIFYCWAASVLSYADCQKARPDDVPHGANFLLELKEQKINRLFGTIFLPDHTPANDTVVEVYRQSGAKNYQEPISGTRLTACITGTDGKFSFPQLKPGKYLLLVGVRQFAGIAETDVPIILNSIQRKWKSKGLRIVLVVGN